MSKSLIIRFAVILAAVISTVSTTAAGERFTDNGDGTVTDHLMGLMWAKTDNHGDINWNQAEKWVQYTFPYILPKLYDNWRMPDIRELESLVNPDTKYRGYETDCGQWVKIVPEIRLSCGWIWSSETDPIAPTARIFNFDNVYHYTVRKAQKRAYRVLPVRTLE